jgi:hypothetical protein
MMDEATRSNYERAAVALDTHRRTPNLGNLGLRAYRMAYEEMNSRNITIEMIDNRAARLLRECIARNEPLP